mgnify:CR=1 FL=1
MNGRSPPPSGPPRATDESVASDGHVVERATCDGFTAEGADRGVSTVLSDNVDFDVVFVGQYDVGDVQYARHAALNSNNLMYWTTTKNMADGCSAHLRGGLWSGGNLGLPDQAAFLIEGATFDVVEGDVTSLPASRSFPLQAIASQAAVGAVRAPGVEGALGRVGPVVRDEAVQAQQRGRKKHRDAPADGFELASETYDERFADELDRLSRTLHTAQASTLATQPLFSALPLIGRPEDPKWVELFVLLIWTAASPGKSFFERHGELLTPKALAKAAKNDPNMLPPAAIEAYERRYDAPALADAPPPFTRPEE